MPVIPLRATGIAPRASQPSPSPHAPVQNSGRLGWGELLAVADGVVAAGPGWRLLLLGRTRRDPACYQVSVRDERGAPVWPAY